jgi:hypothetical protein
MATLLAFVLVAAFLGIGAVALALFNWSSGRFR